MDLCLKLYKTVTEYNNKLSRVAFKNKNSCKTFLKRREDSQFWFIIFDIKNYNEYTFNYFKNALEPEAEK